MRIGAPLGTASTTDDGSRMGSEQLRKMSPKRTALVPITDTVFEPKIATASLSGVIGLGGFGTSPGRMTGFGVLGKGAQKVPGGNRMCPGMWMASVPVCVAGKMPQ